MKCLRCNIDMKHYLFNQNFKIWGALHQPTPFAAQQQNPYNPKSVYICPKCGCVEFNMNPCDDPDV